MTTLGFFPQITRPTRLSGDSNTLIDNIFTNNFCKPHLAGILVTPVSDHLMQFCIVKGRQGRNINNFPKCIEVENINPLSINNFKHANALHCIALHCIALYCNVIIYFYYYYYHE